LTQIADVDSAVEYGAYDMLGQPQVTRSVRYRNESGLSDTPEVLDVHVQRHLWSIFGGERSRWRMPLVGPEEDPEFPGVIRWLWWTDETRDGAGNIAQQRNAYGAAAPPVGEPSYDAFARSASRLASRKRQLAAGEASTFYDYEEKSGYGPAPLPDLPPLGGPPSGMLGRAVTIVGGSDRGGSQVTRNAKQKIESATDLGMTGRRSGWLYDERGRVRDTVLLGPIGTFPGVPQVHDTMTAADFRSGRSTAPERFTDEQREVLGLNVAATIEPADWAATELSAHRLGTKTMTLGTAPVGTRTYAYEGGRRTGDGVWTHEYDADGNLTASVNAALARRIEYDYNPEGRIVGRRALRLGTDPPQLENRVEVLVTDGLPADTTFVWDPIVDRLVSIFVAGASTAPGAGPESGLLRQYRHADQGYDDPVEVLIADGAGNPRTYLPIRDEAGTGSIQAVLDGEGDLVERVLYADSYGDAPRYLQGAVLDRLSIEATKDGSGMIANVTVKAHLSERVREDTVGAGSRLSVVSGSGAVVAIAGAAPELDEDRATIRWSLDGAQWQSLWTAGGDALEVTILDELRSEGWGDASVMAPPAWAQTLYGVTSTSDAPVVWRERLATLDAEFLVGIPASGAGERGVYEIPDLYLAASTDSKAKLLTGFHTLPFSEPATGLFYARERWYDPRTSTFLSSDPFGYEDSSNLYAFTGGDPVNGRDPTGERCLFVFGGTNETCADVANRGSAALARNKAEVRANVGVGSAGIAEDFLVSTGLDIVDMFILDPLRVGEATGTAIGSDAGALETTLAVVEDVGRGAAIGAGAGSVVKVAGRGARVLRGVTSFDDVAAAGARGLEEGIMLARSELSPQITRTAANLSRGSRAEQAARLMAREAGETIIETQFLRGAATRGFDFLSFTGSGSEVRLFINEVKHYTGRVGSRRFATFGLGRSGQRTFREAMAVAEQRIVTSSLDFATQRALISQLRSGRARVRLIGGRNTVFDPHVMQRLGERTGFLTGQGFTLPW
jgi:RHS repeat-associated protein